MKKFFALLVVVIFLGSIPAYSEEFIENGINYLITSSEPPTVSVCKLPNGGRYSGDIDIPSSIKHNGITYSVTGIRGGAFYDCKNVTSINMPKDIKTIGESAFSGCVQLTQLVFPDSVKYLEILVCYNCESLQLVELPSGIEAIGRSAFNGCKSLEEFTIPDSVKVIYDMAFKNCSNLKKLYWGDSVEEVGIRDGSNQYTSYEGTFKGCNNLNEVHLKNLSTWCKTYYPSYVSNPLYKIVNGRVDLYLNGEKLDTLYVPNDIDVIKKYTFYHCTQLVSIKFPNSDIKVEDEAFSECRSLNSVYFGESTIKLGNQVFNLCENIQYVVSKSREPYMFWDWTFYKPIFGKCTLFIPTGTKEIYATTNGWKNFTRVMETDIDDPGLKVSLKVSGEGEVSVNNTNVDGNNTIIALYDTNVSFSFKPQLGYQLKSFLINGEEFAQDVLNDTYVINQIHDNINVDIVFDETPLADGVLFSDNRIFYSIIEKSDGFCLEVTRKMKSGNTWSYIGDIVIPEYVVFHGDTLFVERIDENTFKGSSSLYSVTMPNTIKAIGKSAFEDCPYLSSITFSNSLCDVGRDAFYGSKWYNSKSNGLVYAGPVAYKYKGTIPQGTSINIKNGTLGIAEQCFLDCTGLSSITIPETVINIGISALQGCKGLTSIKIPESVTHISNYMLSLCSNITEITLGGNVETIGSYAFANTNIGTINLPEGLKEIDNFAFVLCSNLEFLTIPESVNSIGKSAFEGCSKVSSTNIPSSIQFIGERAFYMSELITIESHLLEPFPISNDVFSESVKNNTILVVPTGTKALYEQADGWKSIKNIKEYGGVNGIVNCHLNQGRILSDRTSVIILGGSMDVIQIFDVSGRFIKRVNPSVEDIRIELYPQGTYIIQMGTESYKIII